MSDAETAALEWAQNTLEWAQTTERGGYAGEVDLRDLAAALAFLKAYGKRGEV
tara:strand:+ start:1595 stop:1753 length:159 start_codon:yes stop_codon:yes gene_type:complete